MTIEFASLRARHFDVLADAGRVRPARIRVLRHELVHAMGGDLHRRDLVEQMINCLDNLT